MPNITITELLESQTKLQPGLTLSLNTAEDLTSFLKGKDSSNIKKYISALDLSGIPLSLINLDNVIEALNKLTMITELKLSDCALSDKHEDKLNQLNYVTHLDLSNNLLQRPCNKPSMFYTNLEVLCLNNNPQLDAATVLMSLSRTTIRLAKLELAQCNVTDSDLAPLVSPSYNRLASLNLGNNWLSNGGQDFLTQNNYHLGSLEEIELTGNNGITTLKVKPFSSQVQPTQSEHDYMEKLQLRMGILKEKLDKLAGPAEAEASSSAPPSSPRIIPLDLSRIQSKNPIEQLKIARQLINLHDIFIKKLNINIDEQAKESNELEEQIEQHRKAFFDAENANIQSRQTLSSNSPRSSSPSTPRTQRPRSPSSPRAGSIRNASKFFEQQPTAMQQWELATKLIAAQSALINQLSRFADEEEVKGLVLRS